MKKQLVLLISITFLSFFLVANVVAQDQKKVETKAKTEQVKKEVPSKCATCPSAATCAEKKAAPVEAVTKDKKKVAKKK